MPIVSPSLPMLLSTALHQPNCIMALWPTGNDILSRKSPFRHMAKALVKFNEE